MRKSSTASDYYAVLEIPRTADAAQIKKAYREQALRHHPDKNPDRLEEATARFKMIAEAYSVLQDPQKRAAYDRGEYDDARAGSSGFNDSRARDLFQEVFGAEVVEKLAKAAAHVAPHIERVAKGAEPHLKAMGATTSAAASAAKSGIADAADKVGRVSVVKSAVAAGLSSMTSEAESEVTQKAHEEELSTICWKACVKQLHEHEDRIAAVQQERAERQVSFWQRMQWISERRRKEQELAFDREAEQTTLYLRNAVTGAARDLQRKQKDLQEAERAAQLARDEVEEVQREGASIGRAAKVGAHFLGRLAAQVKQAHSSYSVNEARALNS